MPDLISRAFLVLTWIQQRWLLLVIILAVVAGGSLWWYRQRANTPVLIFIQPEYKDLTKTLEVPGNIDAKEKARLRFIAGGKVTYLGAQTGDAVKKHQTIATIDQATLQKQLEKDLNTYLQERWDWEQLRDDTKDRALPTRELRSKDKSQWDLTNTVLDVEIRDIAIQNTRLTAPFDGIVTVSPITTSGVQLLSTDYFELINPSSLVFRAHVDEADIGLVANEQSTVITLDSFPDDTLESYVSFISPSSAETSTGTVFIIEMPLQGVEDLLRYRLGMNGEVAIQLEKKYNVLSVPIETIIQRADKSFVLIQTDENMAEEREVTTGLETEDDIEILSGLSSSDYIVLPE